jgi:hypothetical protein
MQICRSGNDRINLNNRRNGILTEEIGRVAGIFHRIPGLDFLFEESGYATTLPGE